VVICPAPVGEVFVLGSSSTFERGRWSGTACLHRVWPRAILGTGTKNAADLGQLTSGWLVPYAVAGYRCLGGGAAG
jgi:hypothetical protein